MKVINGNGQVSIAMDGSTVEAKNTVNVNAPASDVLTILDSIKAMVASANEIITTAETIPR